MTTNVVVLPTDHQERVVSEVGSGVNASGQINVPDDWQDGDTGSVSVMEYGDAPFNATVNFGATDKDFSGAYALVERTLYFEVGRGLFQRGATVYVNVSIAHDGKPGGKNWNPPTKQIAFELRPAQ